MRLLLLALIATLTLRPAFAEPLRVVVDIAPVHALVSQVMDGVAEPDLLIPARVSPHGHSLKPSQARTLSQADLVVWVGEPLTPWLEQTLSTLASEADHLELLTINGLSLKDYREAGDGHDHGHGHDHDHGAHDADPHIWLDPVNAVAMVEAIAARLAQHDPENAERYHANGARAVEELTALTQTLTETLRPAKGARYIVFHDAYQYFEQRFDLGAAIAIAGSHAAQPGAKRISEIRRAMDETGARCVFAEVQFDPRSTQAITRGTDAKLETLDPLGEAFTPGPALYAQTMQALADSFVRCFR